MTGSLTRTLLPTLEDDLVQSFSAFIAEHTGLAFLPSRRFELERGILALAHRKNFDDARAYIESLLRHSATPQGELAEIITQLTVGETYFFRERHTFDILEREVLPALIEERRATRRLRLWSAGCSTGEEAYTLAIIIHRLLGRERGWEISIAGTDINAQALEIAQRGEYGAWSFRGVDESVRNAYFSCTPSGSSTVLPDVRKYVSFFPLNLAESSLPSRQTGIHDCDVILCRNVLMYLQAEAASALLDRLHECLCERGSFAVAAAEVPLVAGKPFVTRYYPQAILFVKDTAHQGTVWFRQGAPSCAAPPPPPVPALQGAPAAPQEPAAVGVIPERTGAVRASKRRQSPAHAPPPEKAPVQDWESLPRTARALADRGRYPDAMAACERSIAEDRSAPAPYLLLATLCIEAGDEERARVLLRKALYLDRDFAVAHLRLGHLSMSCGHVDEARRHFQNALASLRRQPESAEVPESDGFTAGRLRQMIEKIVASMGGGG